MRSQNKASYKVKGVEFEVPENEKVEIEVISPGDPEAAPASAGQEVEMAYEGRLLDGSVFDSSKSFKFELGAGEVCLRAYACCWCGCGPERYICLQPLLPKQVIKGWDVGVKGSST